MFRDNTEAILRRLQNLSIVMEREANRTLSDAQEAAPRQDGELAESGAVERVGDQWDIGFTAEHAPFIELGTAHQDARPFLTPAADGMKTRLPDTLRRHLEGA